MVQLSTHTCTPLGHVMPRSRKRDRYNSTLVGMDAGVACLQGTHRDDVHTGCLPHSRLFLKKAGRHANPIISLFVAKRLEIMLSNFQGFFITLLCIIGQN